MALAVAPEDVKAQADEVEELMSDIEEQAAELAEADGQPGSTAPSQRSSI
ncbi:MAG: hypothetical protein ACRD0V_07125 [Acidimicrobiales bacterium]